MARAVALLGDGAELPTVAALAQLPEDEVAAALDTLSRSEILTETSAAWLRPPAGPRRRLRRPAGRERALHHERAARILLSAGRRAEQVAAHLLLAPAAASAATVERPAGGGADGDRAAAPRTRRSTLLRRALEEPVPARSAPACSSSWAVEALVDGPAAWRT